MSSDVYDRYITDAVSWADTVEFWRAVLYCHAMSRRLEPSYATFHQRERWGSPQLLAEARHSVYSWLISGELDDAATRALLAKMEPIIPHADDFADCSDAIDAAAVHVYSIEAILEHSLQHVAYVYTIAYDRADAAAGDVVLPDGGIYTPDVEAAIERHPYVQDEIAWQRQVFALLRSGPLRNEKSISHWLSHLPAMPRFGPYALL